MKMEHMQKEIHTQKFHEQAIRLNEIYKLTIPEVI